MVAALAAGSTLVRGQQKPPGKTAPPNLKLPYARDDFESVYTGAPDIAPIPVVGNRWLFPAGDMLYMIDSNNRIQWEFSVEPNFIFDVAVDAKGLIYIAVFDGLLECVNDAGQQVWSKFMNGSANYTQLKPYRDGVLAVLSMETYRASKGSDSEDKLLFWNNDKITWEKEFPRNAKLEVLAGRILAVKTTNAGKEITVIP